MIPTTKIRQDTMVFTYLKAYLISVGFTHIGGNEPLGRAGCRGGSGTEALFFEGSGALEPLWESRMKREAPTSATIRRHSRAMALIFKQASHSHNRTFTPSKSRSGPKIHQNTLRDTYSSTHTHPHTEPRSEPGSMSLSPSLFCSAKKEDEPSCNTKK